MKITVFLLSIFNCKHKSFQMILLIHRHHVKQKKRRGKQNLNLPRIRQRILQHQKDLSKRGLCLYLANNFMKMIWFTHICRFFSFNIVRQALVYCLFTVCLLLAVCYTSKNVHFSFCLTNCQSLCCDYIV